jgi:hypothetical protein
MQWATLSLLVPFALCTPAVLPAQEAPLPVTKAREALKDFGGKFSACFIAPQGKLRIAVAQMLPSSQLEDEQADRVTGWIEEALVSEFVVAPLRLSEQLTEAINQLLQLPPVAPPARVDGIVLITLDAVHANGGTTVKVTSHTAYPTRVANASAPADTFPWTKSRTSPSSPGRFSGRPPGRSPMSESTVWR